MNPCDACDAQQGGTGGFYGARAGRKIGRFLGQAGEGLVRKYASPLLSFFGSGDYSVKYNSLIDGGGVHSGKHVSITTAGRETRVIFREYLGDVITGPNGVFTSQSYEINPGLPSTFPWLSGIAAQYEQWTPNGLIFEFRSTSSEYVAQQAMGSVIMATEYDSYDTVYSSKIEMLNSAYSSECKPSETMLHGIECAPNDNPNTIYYTRTDSNIGARDLTDMDIGRFTIATQGLAVATSVNVGSIYVHYDITFRKEQIYRSLLKNQRWMRYQIPTSYIGTAGLFTDFNVLPKAGNWTGFTSDSLDTLIFPPDYQAGSFCVMWTMYNQAATAWTRPTQGILVNCSTAGVSCPFYGANEPSAIGSVFASPQNATQTRDNITYCYNVNGATGVQQNWLHGGAVGANCQFTLCVFEMNDDWFRYLGGPP